MCSTIETERILQFEVLWSFPLAQQCGFSVQAEKENQTRGPGPHILDQIALAFEVKSYEVNSDCANITVQIRIVLRSVYMQRN